MRDSDITTILFRLQRLFQCLVLESFCDCLRFPLQFQQSKPWVLIKWSCGARWRHPKTLPTLPVPRPPATTAATAAIPRPRDPRRSRRCRPSKTRGPLPTTPLTAEPPFKWKPRREPKLRRAHSTTRLWCRKCCAEGRSRLPRPRPPPPRSKISTSLLPSKDQIPRRIFPLIRRVKPPRITLGWLWRRKINDLRIVVISLTDWFPSETYESFHNHEPLSLPFFEAFSLWLLRPPLCVTCVLPKSLHNSGISTFVSSIAKFTRIPVRPKFFYGISVYLQGEESFKKNNFFIFLPVIYIFQ